MYLSPSLIHYMNSEKNNMVSTESVEQNIIDVSRKIIQNGDIPKIQVVEKEGHWFTLNNAQLDLCRTLERAGKCTEVRVDLVSLSEVPEAFRNMMLVPNPDMTTKTTTTTAAPQTTTQKCHNEQEQHTQLQQQQQQQQLQQQQQQQQQSSEHSEGGDDTSRSTGKGYQKLGQSDLEEKEEGSGSCEGCSTTDDNSEFDSDSECDWSDDELESSEGEGVTTGGEEAEQSTDDERECLL